MFKSMLPTTEKLMITSVDTEKAFDKVQHHDKNLGIEDTFLNLKKTLVPVSLFLNYT